jgi:putative endonuclease
MYYTYIVRTEKGSLYTGITNNMFHRMAEHFGQGKKSAKFTRSQKIISLEALWSSADRSTASKLEARLKRLTKKQKEEVLKKPSLLFDFLPMLEKEDYIFHPKASLDLYLGKITLPHLL